MLSASCSPSECVREFLSI
uniref:Uncharacterized protein n=1 Tax=Anguilla anguilla TaxID=7936 RepID=A0A0E9TVT0_ANGAN